MSPCWDSHNNDRTTLDDLPREAFGDTLVQGLLALDGACDLCGNPKQNNRASTMTA